MPSLETFGGTFFDLDHPRAEDVHLDDITVALSNTCRFGGHSSRFYSVAEHACLVYQLVKDAGGSPEVCLAALHHDSHEAYVGDVPTPLKAYVGEEWVTLVACVDYAIATRYGISQRLFRHPMVKAADLTALRLEAQAFKRSGGVGPHWGFDAPVALPDLAYGPRGLDPEVARGYFERCHVAALAGR